MLVACQQEKQAPPEKRATDLFYFALASQSHYARSARPLVDKEYLSAAINGYRMVLGLVANDSLTLGNLAYAYSQAGDSKKADNLFVDALRGTSGKVRAGILRLSATSRVRSKEFVGAADQLEEYLAITPADDSIRTELLGLWNRVSPERMTPTLWAGLDSGRSQWARRSSLELLGNLKQSPDARRRYFDCFIESYRRSPPSTEEKAILDGVLNSLIGDAVLGDAARDVLGVIAGTILSLSDPWRRATDYYPHSSAAILRGLIVDRVCRYGGGLDLSRSTSLLDLSYSVAGARGDPRIASCKIDVLSGAGKDPAAILAAVVPYAASEVNETGFAREEAQLNLLRTQLLTQTPDFGRDTGRARIAQDGLTAARQAATQARDPLLLIAIAKEQERIGFPVDALGTYAEAQGAALEIGDADTENEARQFAVALRQTLVGGSGGGGGGSAREARYSATQGDCIGGRGLCSLQIRLEIPDILVGREKLLLTGTTRSLEIGCSEAPRVFSLALASAKRELSRASFRGVLDGQQFAGVTLDFRSAYLRNRLETAPLWPTSGFWLRDRLYLADRVRGSILRYGKDGRLQEIQGERDVATIGANGGRVSFESKTGSFVVLAGGRKETIQWLGLHGSFGELRAALSWQMRSERSWVVLGRFVRGRSWRVGVVLVSLDRPDSYRTLLDLGEESEETGLYDVTQRPLVVSGNLLFVLDFRKKPAIITINLDNARKGVIHLIPSVHYDSSRLKSMLSRQIRDPRDVSRAMVRSALPAALFSIKDDLFLLSREPMNSSRTRWSVALVNRVTGEKREQGRLPSTADYLVLLQRPEGIGFIECSELTEKILGRCERIFEAGFLPGDRRPLL